MSDPPWVLALKWTLIGADALIKTSCLRSALPKPPNSPPGRSLLPPQELSTKAKEKRRRDRMPSRRNDCFVAILLVVDDEAEGG
jgi:hypothetical protein